MNTQIKLILSATVVAATLGSSAAFAGASANVGATTNYIFRGLEAASGRGAGSGGVDYEMANGLSVGTWASTTDATLDGTGYEIDLYGSYGGKISELVGYSVGATSYQYPGAKGAGNSTHLEEINLGLSFGAFEAAAAIGVGSNAKDYDYFSLSTSKDINGITLGGTIGKGDFGGASGDYTHLQLSAGKGDFTLALDKASGDAVRGSDDEDVKASLSYAHSFDY
jgi:uncharacterized protein (TIGR02001 family)